MVHGADRGRGSGGGALASAQASPELRIGRRLTHGAELYGLAPEARANTHPTDGRGDAGAPARTDGRPRGAGRRGASVAGRGGRRTPATLPPAGTNPEARARAVGARAESAKNQRASAIKRGTPPSHNASSRSSPGIAADGSEAVASAIIGTGLFTRHTHKTTGFGACQRKHRNYWEPSAGECTPPARRRPAGPALVPFSA
jgi:hypothetical protein